MKPELDPEKVVARLAELRAAYVPEGVSDARRRLAHEIPPRSERFERRVARSLAELRALCDLAAHLHERLEPDRTS